MRHPDPGPIADPESAVPSARARIARRALLGAVLLGVLADPLLRNGPSGLGLLAWMVAFAIVAITLIRQDGHPLAPASASWLAVAVLFAAGLSWHDADMLQGFDFLAMLSALALLAMSVAPSSVPSLAVARVRDLIRGAFGIGLDVGTGVVPLVLRDAEWQAATASADRGTARRVGRALLFTVPVLLVFGILLAQADPVFSSLFRFLNIDLDVALSHVLIAGFFTWVVAGWLRGSLLAHPATTTTPPSTALPVSLGTTDLAFTLGALNILFAAFVVVQIGWLFGGEALVLRTTGLSYAEYARHGFFELLWVAGLLLPVLLGAQALIPAAELRTLRLYRRLAVPLVMLLGAIMVSAGVRMNLYIHYYGISTDRLYASAFMIWLAIVFAWLAVTVLRGRPRAFAAGLVVTGFGVLFVLNVLNPDALVARAILQRGDTGRAGKTGMDLQYVARLGGDAVPMLVSALAGPGATTGPATPDDRCAAARILLERWTGQSSAGSAHNWTQWNSARTRAVKEVRAHEAELQRISCAKPRGPVG